MNYFKKYHIIEKMQYNNFGKFLRDKREKMQITLNKFALQNDIEPAILSRVETQKQGVSLFVLGKIANGFGITVSELIKEYEVCNNK